MDRGARPVRRAAEMARARRLRHDRTARRARLPDVVLHHAADQQAHRRVRRHRSKTACAIRSRSSARCARSWPDDKPMSVRISANDWVGDDGVTPDGRGRDRADAAARPASTSSTSRPGRPRSTAKPVYGRMFQTPFSDRIRNEAGIATMAVGNIYEPDHVNSILMAGRADLVCLARPHLADPYWTLHAGRRARRPRRRMAGPLSARPRPALPARRRSAMRRRSPRYDRSLAGTRWSPAAAPASARRSRGRSPMPGVEVTICGRRRRRARSRRCRQRAHPCASPATSPTSMRCRRSTSRPKRRAGRSTSSSPMPAPPKARRPTRPRSTTWQRDARRQPHRRVPHRASRRCAGMAARKAGRIIFIASTAGLKGYPYVARLRRGQAWRGRADAGARAEIAETGVTVNAVCPGYVETDDARASDRQHRREDRPPGRGSARLARRDQPAGPADRAGRSGRRGAVALRRPGSASITGQAIAISGGETW